QMWQVIPEGQQLARCQMRAGLREAALRASDLGRTRRPPLPTKREARGSEIVCAISTWLSSIWAVARWLESSVFLIGKIHQLRSRRSAYPGARHFFSLAG